MAGAACRSTLKRHLCKYCGLFGRTKPLLFTSTLKPAFSTNAGRSTDSPKGLDEDKSWEAEVLRHEKQLDTLRKQGVERDKLPVFERERKVQDLPHLSFKERSRIKRDESLLDITSKIILGHVGVEGDDADIKEAPNENNLDPDFIREDVQALLQKIHFNCDIEKVYKHTVTRRENMPSVKYMTDKQLEEERRKFKDLMTKKISMPLVMKEREPCDSILARDSLLDGYEDSNVSFVDVSEDIPNNRERFVVIRQPDGTLRKANWKERDRLLQTYFPIPERRTVPPSVFKAEHLKNALLHDLHENILDRCMVQFEPDSSDYIRVFEEVYKDVEDRELYDSLRSTRYFGGLVFFLAQNRMIDGLLHNLMSRGLLEDAVDVVRLFTLLHPESKTSAAAQSFQEEETKSLLELYIGKDSQDIKALSLAFENIASSDAAPT